MQVKRKIDWQYISSVACRGFMLLAIGALFALSLSSCGSTRTVAPRPVTGTTASLDSHGKPTSGILEFHSDHIVVEQHWMDRYKMMVGLNAQKPDIVNGKPNPSKVFIVGQENIDIEKNGDGTYKASYVTLMYFDRLTRSLKSSRKTE